MKPQNTSLYLSVALCLVSISVVAQGAATPAALTAMDHIEIQQLNAAYARYIDTGEENGEAWARLFTQDGVFTRQAKDRYAGRQQLAELARVTGRGPHYVAHFLTNLLVKAAPGGAVGSAYCMVVRFPDDKMGDADPRPTVPGAGCRYDDVYVKTAEGWKFKSRTVVVSKSNRPPTAGTAGPSSTR